MVQGRFGAIAAAMLILLSLGACTVPRGPTLQCSGFGRAADNALPSLAAADAGAGPIAAAVERFLTQPAGRGVRDAGPVRLDYLVLSTGGQFGAFGSGFLTGWAENRANPRPDFDVVTGASAGGVVAPFALAGRGFDDRLALNAGIGAEDVVRQRSILEILGSTSLLDVSPFAAKIREAVDPPLVAALAARYAEGRAVFIGAVNLDTTAFEVVDLARIAAEDPNAEPCIEEAMLATSAIPGLFPPRDISGALYADAGLRDHVFFAGVREAVRRARAQGVQVELNAYIVVNGDLRAPSRPIENNLREIALRSLSITADQGLRSSVLEILRLDELTDWNLRAITARDVDLRACGFGETATESKERALFDACITRTLFDAGRAYGSAPRIPWLTADELRDLAENG